MTISEISRLLGFSSEAIRKYEKKGIFAATRNAANHYREFSVFDVGTLVCARQLRQCGFSVDDSANILNNTDHQSFKEKLCARGKEVEEEIRQKQQQLATIRYWAQTLEDYHLQLRYQHMPADLLFVPYMDAHGLLMDRVQMSYASMLLPQFPYAFTGILYTPATQSFQVGIFSPWSDEQGVPAYSQRCPAQTCAVFSSVINSSNWLADEIDTICARIRDDGFEICGPVMGKYIYVENSNDPACRSMEYEYWLPVKKRA